MSYKGRTYPRIISEMTDWPIYKLSQDRENFIREIDEFTYQKLIIRHRKDLPDVIGKTLYLERIRIKESPWKVDPPNERVFWNKISKQLIKRSLDREGTGAMDATKRLLEKIIHRYSEEIVGTFKPSTFRFAQRFLTALFNRLFNAAVDKSIRSLWTGRRQLYERLNVVGEVETVRELFKHGTVIVVPTHFSNLDSILVGYTMDQIVGLPSFSYGAGLNLYNFGPAAYFMNRLGAYRVDRRKKNSIYLETLKAMSKISIERGINSLFFPGGTRSRTGAIETDLKMGLLGTAIEAQRALIQKSGAGPTKKVFIVPMVIGYHFVLEAPYLIEQHLKMTGKEQYLRLKDEGSSIRGWLRYIWQFFSTTSDITLTVGRPLDVMGNFVNEKGHSFDRFGNELDIREYFRSTRGEINEDLQREEEYTKLLADRILERYYVENVVLSSHLVAFAVFEMLLHDNPKLDLYGLLRLPTDDFLFPFIAVEEVIEQLQDILKTYESDGKIQLSPEIRWSASDLIKDGVKKLGLFHREKPLSFNREGNLVSADFRTLYYYHNRLDNYDLARKVHWKAEEIEVLRID